jgi:hypothetical protein
MIKMSNSKDSKEKGKSKSPMDKNKKRIFN